MAAKSKIVNISEITRFVIKALNEKTSDNDQPTTTTSLTSQQVHGVYKCIGNFINFMLHKN